MKLDKFDKYQILSFSINLAIFFIMGIGCFIFENLFLLPAMCVSFFSMCWVASWQKDEYKVLR